MPLPPRLFAGDEELGKRDDEYRPGQGIGLGIKNWQHRRVPHAPHRRTIKRLALGLLALIALYYFFYNMPKGLENPRKRPSYTHPTGSDASTSRPGTTKPSSSKSGHETAADVPRHDFNGPIKFYHLASSLHAVARTGGSDLININVLFTASTLKSAAILLPIACDMAIREKNFVHFALMGRDDISMDILKSVNGITKECKIIFHDARPDFSLQSTDFRMEVSSAAAFSHINTFIHPQATFIDASGEEEVWFLKGLRERANSLGRTVIELPDNAEQNLMWITLLDSASLSAWNKVSVDIIVHAHPKSSGSLVRLLESLKKADFFSSAPPRLTIELPHAVEEPTRRYLERFKWPPKYSPNTGSLLTLHHRIPQHGLTAEENSIRLLESFWPADPHAAHVLVLSPQAELSPLFFHYLKYTILAYKYSTGRVGLHQNLMGISLDLPSRYLNESTEFEPPLGNTTIGGNVVSKGVTPFLWQAPNSNAQLFFGEKWVELHDFVSRMLASQHSLATPTTLNTKEVSTIYPSWLEHILKLARARGYSTVYPNLETGNAFCTLHDDLYQLPEENKAVTESELGKSEELKADPAQYVASKHSEASLVKISLLNILPFAGELPKVSEMPSLSWDGERLTAEEINESAEQYSSIFKREIGGCSEEEESMGKIMADMSAYDLFCFGNTKA